MAHQPSLPVLASALFYLGLACFIAGLWRLLKHQDGSLGWILAGGGAGLIAVGIWSASRAGRGDA